jgi:hypothetical protein
VLSGGIILSGERFDELAKGLATKTSSRRGFLAGLAGAGAAAATLLRPNGATAQIAPPGGSDCANAGQSCTAQQCCGGYTCLFDDTSSTDKFCCPDNLVCGSRCCPTGAACTGGRCVCPPGTVAVQDRPFGICCPEALVCGNACLATACNPAACEICDATQGQCVSTCTGQETCINGACCPNVRVCGNTCLATACDPDACEICDPTQGTCVSTCVAGQECQNGFCVCTPASCPDGCCEGSTCEGGNTNAACGTAGAVCVTCPSGTQCQNGSCVCGPGACSGCCQNNVCQPGNANQACGTGGAICATCPSGTQCQNGSCVPVCSPATCPSGCCQNNFCQPGTSPGACRGEVAGVCLVCGGTTSFCCPPGSARRGCRRPPNAECSNDNQCCNSCALFGFVRRCT